jgi:hypothetical protein
MNERKTRIKALHTGMLVNLKDEIGTYILLGFDKVNQTWDFKEFCTCEHSCCGGHTKKSNVSKIVIKGAKKK